MKRILYIFAAIGLLATGYAVGISSTLNSHAQPLFQPGCQTFPETKQTVCGRFLVYWQEHGGVAQQGFPISGEIQEKSDLNGQTYTVQYFERAVFEKHPENQPPYDVLLSQLGTFRYQAKYGSGSGSGSGGSSGGQATPTPQAPAFVELNDPVTRNGLTFRVYRLDRLQKRVDVAYSVTNNSGGPVTFVLANKDQRLLNDANADLQLADPNGVTTVVIQNGKEYLGGVTFSGTLAADSDYATYAADNITGIGSVRVRIVLR